MSRSNGVNSVTRSGTAPAAAASWCACDFAVHEPHTERAEPLLREQPVGLRERHCLRLRIPALRDIPEPLLATAPDDRDVASAVQDLQHQGDLSGAVPAMRLARPRRAILELAREQRATRLQLVHDVAAKRRVLLQELGAAALPRVLPAAPPHPRANERQRFHRPDEGAPLEELAVGPEEPVELAEVVRAEPAPEHELLRGCDGRDRIDLEVAELPHGA